ncbi:MAG: outer membrane protein [Pararhodobacter sp.]
MKYLLSVPMALALSATAALASGPSVPPQVYVQPQVAMASASWTGFYAGAALGYGSTNYDLSGTYDDPPFSADLNLPDLGGQGGLFGLQAGYNHQFSDRMVLGLQLDGAVTGMKNSSSLSLTDGVDSINLSYDLSPRTMYTLAGRIGYLATPDTMIYGLLGYTRASFRGELDATDIGLGSASYSFSRNGVAVGMGIETRVARNTTLGVEYRYNHMQRYSFYDGPLFGGDNLEVGFNTSIHTARVSLNVHF